MVVVDLLIINCVPKNVVPQRPSLALTPLFGNPPTNPPDPTRTSLLPGERRVLTGV
jgi:hypothetical protein